MAGRSIAGSAATGALLVPFLFGCISPIRTPKSPAEGGRWTRLTTSHFVVLTDVSETEARAAVTEYETAFEQLRATGFPHFEPPPPLIVVLFRDEGEQRSLRPHGQPADYIDRGRSDVEATPALILHAGGGSAARSRSREALQARLTSGFVRQRLSAAPAWLRAGLAQYFSTMREDGPSLLLGAPPDEYSAQPPLEGVTVGALLAFTDLGDDSGDRGTWSLVRFFADGPAPIRSKFDSFLRRLESGGNARDAWRETVGTVPRAEIDRAFADYMAAERGHLTRRPLPRIPWVPRLGVELMTDEEVHLLWARIADLFEAGGSSEMARLAEAARAAPGSAEVRYLRGCVALGQGQARRAAGEFEAALAKAPDDPRYLFGALEATAGGGTGESEAIRGKVRDWSARLARTARSADELSMAARIEADAGKDAEALRHADAAVAADPGSYAAFASRAFVHFRAGRYAQAVTDQEGAVARVHGEGDAQVPARTLQVYREARAGWPETQ